jgi:outer membrane protein assembly factor BamB
MRLLLAALLFLPAVALAADPMLEAAPPEAWPLARGCLAGTGRSEMSVRLPLEKRWERRFDRTSFAATPVIAAGMVYVGDLDGSFHALALDSGETKWTYRAEGAGFPSSAAVSPDPALPLVVIGDDTGLVRALDVRTGAVAWEYTTEGEISGGPTIIPGDAAAGRAARVLVGSQDATLSCLNLADGAVAWKLELADQIRCGPTVARSARGDRVFIAGCDGKLHVVDAADGGEVHAVPIDGPTGTTPTVADDRVFFGTEGGSFFAIDFVAGAEVWRARSSAGGQSYRSSAAVADGLVVVGSRGKAVEAFSRDDGVRKWRQPRRGRVDASPAVVHDGDPAARGDDLVVVADASGTVAILRAADGSVAWEFAAGGGFSAGAAVAAGHVVIAADDGAVWCFASPER